MPRLILIFILISRMVFAECEPKLKACDELQKAQAAQIDGMKALVLKQEDYIKLVEKQRNDAYDRIPRETSIPFYVWVALGMAGGIVLVRGFR